MKGKQAIQKVKTGKVRKLLGNLHHRIILSATIGFVFHLAYGLYYGVLGVLSSSLWFLLLGAYFILLSVMRFSAILYDRRQSQSSRFSDLFLMRFTGILLVFLAVVLSISVFLSCRYDVVIRYPKIVMITIAAYTFYKGITAIVHLVKVRKQNSQLFRVIRNIGGAEAAASILTLQRSMLVSFGDGAPQITTKMNALSGAVVCLYIATLGFCMIWKKEKSASNQPESPI